MERRKACQRSEAWRGHCSTCRSVGWRAEHNSSKWRRVTADPRSRRHPVHSGERGRGGRAIGEADGHPGMRSILKALKMASSLAASLVAIALGGLGVLWGVFTYSETNTREVYAGCMARTVEHGLQSKAAVRFVNLCMVSEGYHVQDVEWCREGPWTAYGPNPYGPRCFVPKWIFWVATQDVVL